MRTLEAFYDYNAEIRIILVLPTASRITGGSCAGSTVFIAACHCRWRETRFHSVKNGLALVKTPALVGVHDGVRPFVARK